MKVCPQCQREYPNQSTFCRQDGATLIVQSVVAATIPAEPIPAAPSPTSHARPDNSVPIVTPVPLSVNGLRTEPPPLAQGLSSETVSTPLRASHAPRTANDAPILPSLCRKCRKPLGDNDPFCASCGTPTTTAQALCPHCGQQHPVPQRFCPRTGQPIRPAPFQRVGKTPLYATLAALAAAILLLSLFFGVQHFQSTRASGTQVSNVPTSSTPTIPIPTATPPQAALATNKAPTNPPPAPVKALSTLEATPAITTFTDGVANASSFESPHYARLAFDGNQNTIWHTEKYQNAWLSVKYPTPRYVTQISMIGCSLRQFYESARIKDVRLRFSSGETEPLHLDDVRQMQTKKLPHPILTNSIQFEFVGLYPGKTMHLIIPEIVVHGYKP